jgi:hypothetical protein
MWCWWMMPAVTILLNLPVGLASTRSCMSRTRGMAVIRRSVTVLPWGSRRHFRHVASGLSVRAEADHGECGDDCLWRIRCGARFAHPRYQRPQGRDAAGCQLIRLCFRQPDSGTDSLGRLQHRLGQLSDQIFRRCLINKISKSFKYGFGVLGTALQFRMAKLGLFAPLRFKFKRG